MLKKNTYDYRKNQSYTTDRQATSATGRWLSPRQEPRFPYALPRDTAESQGSDLQRSWGTDRDVYIPSERGVRLNIFGMIDRNNRYEGFSTTENMTAEKIADFLDKLSMRIRKKTFVVLDNASVHRCRLMKELRPIWEKRGLFLFLFLHIALISTSPRHSGESSRANGPDLWIIFPQTTCFTQPIELWPLLDLNSIPSLPMQLSIN